MWYLSRRIGLAVLWICLFQLSARLPVAAAPGVTPSPCDHAYLPLRPGNYWVYEVIEAPSDQRAFTLRKPVFRRDATRCAGLDCAKPQGLWLVDHVDQVQEGAADTLLTTAEIIDGPTPQFLSYSVSVQCAEAGLVESRSAGADRFRPFADDFLGVYFLHLAPEQQLAPGHSWIGDAYQNVKRGGGMSSLYETQTETYTVTGHSPITLNGQRYEGLQITKTFTISQTGCAYIAVCDDPQSASTLKGTVIFTLARGIGIVQIVSSPPPGQTRYATTLVESNLFEASVP